MAVIQPNGSRAPAPDGPCPAIGRRELLGAVALAPGLVGVAGLASFPRERESIGSARDARPGRTPDQVRGDEGGRVRRADRWERALARVRSAEAALASLAGTDDDDLYGRVLDRFNRALARLLRTPAPDPAALAGKLDLLVANEVWELSFAEPALTAIRRDARRLAANG